ncbi:MAG: hypothetical protein HWD61_01755 [Parachlamydiaceae bacterium]|nr:MAG: hypothetical protein HWD61_01755 [Parachlamydiaceae bacterium]
MKEDQSQETAKTKNAPAILVIDDDIDCCTFLEKLSPRWDIKSNLHLRASRD